MKNLLDWKLMFTLLATFAVYMYVVAPMLAKPTTTTNGNGNGNGATAKKR